MLGAIAGDIIGSVHEYIATKSSDFDLFVAESRFTDDTVLAVAVADCLVNGREYVDAFHEYFSNYPNAGYGFRFYHWARAGRREPYNSYGNGSAAHRRSGDGGARRPPAVHRRAVQRPVRNSRGLAHGIQDI